MPRHRTAADSAAGKLILAIQKLLAEQWGDMERYYFAEAVMDRAHHLQGAIIHGQLPMLLAGRTIREYLNAGWLLEDAGIARELQTLESALDV